MVKIELGSVAFKVDTLPCTLSLQPLGPVLRLKWIAYCIWGSVVILRFRQGFAGVGPQLEFLSDNSWFCVCLGVIHSSVLGTKCSAGDQNRTGAKVAALTSSLLPVLSLHCVYTCNLELALPGSVLTLGQGPSRHAL